MPHSLRFPRLLASSISIACVAAIGCGSSSAAAPDTSTLNGDAGGLGGNGAITGTYGTDAIKPVVAAYWIGQPGNADESAGGPFLYVFSGPVTCDDISKGADWVGSLPAGTQVLELIVGTTATAMSVPASAHAGANLAEVNYFFGQTTSGARATRGTFTLTSYTKGVAADGMIDMTFPTGSAKGTFHATWCAGGHERG